MAQPTQPAFTPRRPVQSSLLASVGYCPFTWILDVELRDGSLYRYYRVPVYICWNLLCADSKGRYFIRYVKGAFAYQRLSPPRRSVGVGRWPQPRLRQAQESGA
jgi:hypothetical protein